MKVKIKRFIRIILVATLTWLVLTSISGCVGELIIPVDTGQEQDQDIEECSQNFGSYVCDFKLTDQDGEDFNLYDHRGKIIILDFSAMWCGPCKSAAMSVDALVEKFGKENVVYVTLLIENSYGEDPSQADLESWANTYGINISPVLGASREFLSQTGYQVISWPTFYFIDRNMILRDSVVGWSGPLIENHVSKLILEQDTGLEGS